MVLEKLFGDSRSMQGCENLQGMKFDLRTQGGGHTEAHEFAINMHFAPDKIS